MSLSPEQGHTLLDVDLSRRMWELQCWLATQNDTDAERHVYTGPPHGRALLTLDAASTSPAASMNGNRIAICGTDGGLTERGLRELLAKFTDRGITRVFIWLSPGADTGVAREWVGALKGRRVPWTRYPTLLFGADTEPPRPAAFEIRQVDSAGFAAASPALGDAVLDGYERTLDRPGFHHFIAWEGGRPVAAAALVQFQDVGYLTYAGTVESARGRGAQSALIAHRVALARSLGCERIVSQTLTMLEHSFANLRRAGFREVYEQDVYEITRDVEE